MTVQIMINLLQISIYLSYLEQRQQSNRSKKLNNFLLCHMGTWAGGHSFAYQHSCHNIYEYRDFPNFEQS